MTPVPRLLATVEPDIWTASCAPSPQPRATRAGGDSGRVSGGAGGRSVVDCGAMRRLVALAAGPVIALFTGGEWKPITHRVSAASLRQRPKQELLPF